MPPFGGVFVKEEQSMYFFIHTQILKDSAPIAAFAYDTMTAALSALYSGMAYDVAADAVLRSWAKVYTETGQTLKEEEYVKVIEQTATEPATTTTADTSDSQPVTDTASETSSDKVATEATEVSDEANSEASTAS